MALPTYGTLLARFRAPLQRARVLLLAGALLTLLVALVALWLVSATRRQCDAPAGASPPVISCETARLLAATVSAGAGAGVVVGAALLLRALRRAGAAAEAVRVQRAESSMGALPSELVGIEPQYGLPRDGEEGGD